MDIDYDNNNRISTNGQNEDSLNKQIFGFKSTQFDSPIPEAGIVQCISNEVGHEEDPDGLFESETSEESDMDIDCDNNCISINEQNEDSLNENNNNHTPEDSTTFIVENSPQIKDDPTSKSIQIVQFDTENCNNVDIGEEQEQDEAEDEATEERSFKTEESEPESELACEEVVFEEDKPEDEDGDDGEEDELEESELESESEEGFELNEEEEIEFDKKEESESEEEFESEEFESELESKEEELKEEPEEKATTGSDSSDSDESLLLEDSKMSIAQGNAIVESDDSSISRWRSNNDNNRHHQSLGLRSHSPCHAGNEDTNWRGLHQLKSYDNKMITPSIDQVIGVEQRPFSNDNNDLIEKKNRFIDLTNKEERKIPQLPPIAPIDGSSKSNLDLLAIKNIASPTKSDSSGSLGGVVVTNVSTMRPINLLQDMPASPRTSDNQNHTNRAASKPRYHTLRGRKSPLSASSHVPVDKSFPHRRACNNINSADNINRDYIIREKQGQEIEFYNAKAKNHDGCEFEKSTERVVEECANQQNEQTNTTGNFDEESMELTETNKGDCSLEDQHHKQTTITNTSINFKQGKLMEWTEEDGKNRQDYEQATSISNGKSIKSSEDNNCGNIEEENHQHQHEQIRTRNEKSMKFTNEDNDNEENYEHTKEGKNYQHYEQATSTDNEKSMDFADKDYIYSCIEDENHQHQHYEQITTPKENMYIEDEDSSYQYNERTIITTSTSNYEYEMESEDLSEEYDCSDIEDEQHHQQHEHEQITNTHELREENMYINDEDESHQYYEQTAITTSTGNCEYEMESEGLFQAYDCSDIEDDYHQHEHEQTIITPTPCYDDDNGVAEMSEEERDEEYDNDNDNQTRADATEISSKSNDNNNNDDDDDNDNFAEMSDEERDEEYDHNAADTDDENQTRTYATEISSKVSNDNDDDDNFAEMSEEESYGDNATYADDENQTRR
eukprot:TRINITY_DN933_c1_g2_i1.p1 TRINITY_DN933_c1_g2~~TRINITY_DN933_c1_g2_i1.p1  ORF type:complete len:1032 (+),score=346.89 TRINITY_DN933_c1_g2_i1:218-3097(+)